MVLNPVNIFAYKSDTFVWEVKILHDSVDPTGSVQASGKNSALVSCTAC